MPDPFGPKPCRDCGKELPYKVHTAREYLYAGYKVDPSYLAEKIERGLRNRSETDRERVEFNERYSALAPMGPITEREIGEFAVALWVYTDFEAEHLTAAVQHFGDLGDPDGSECERVEAAKWCSVRSEVLARGTSEEWARSLCNLEAEHGGLHSFDLATATAGD